MKPRYLPIVSGVALCCALAAPAWSQSGAPEPSAAPAAATVPENRLADNFSRFAGSPENAQSLVTGLRRGTAISLSSNGPAGETVTFMPPTRPMGYGNVRIALSLARAQLASQGITNPTPSQLQGALMGVNTPTGTSQGLLQMRSSGMGWGQIAHSLGFKLGAVMSGKQAVGAAAAAGTGSNGGITTAAGSQGAAGIGPRGRSGVTTAGGGSVQAGGHGRGRSGVVNGLGGGGNAHVTTGLGQGGGAAAGATSAAGTHGQSGMAAGHNKP